MSETLLSIGLVTSSGWDEAGGVQTMTRALAGELLRRGHEVSVLALDTSSEQPAGSVIDDREGGVALRRIAWKYESQQRLTDLARTPLLEEAVARWSVEQGLDGVHLQHLSGWGLGVPPRLAELGVPVLWTLHDYWPICPRGQLFSREGRHCEEVSAALCTDCIVATWPRLVPSADAQRDVEERLAAAHRALEACARLYVPSSGAREAWLNAGVQPSRLTVCENGIEPVARSGGMAGADELRVGVLGSVQPSKGVLELARLVVELGAPFSLEVHGPRESYHGDRSCPEALQELAGRAPNLHLAGPFASRQLGEILAGLHLVCVPSIWPETFGLVAREARAAGVPVFASRIGGLDDPAFHLLPPGEWEAWREALVRFAAEPEWRERLAREAFIPRSIQELGEELEREYRALFT